MKGARLCCRVRLRFIWMVRFLRTKYQNVEIVFITHHSEAQEVDEETFFHLGESRRTKVQQIAGSA